MTDFSSTVDSILTWIGFLPLWVQGLILLAIAAAIALVVHAAVATAFRRALRGRATYLSPILRRIRGPSRAALLLLAWSIAVQSTVFSEAVAFHLGRALLVAFVALVGWAAISAINLASDIYLRRFALDQADNLLARKQYTQVRILRRTAVIVVGALTIGVALMTLEPVRQFGISILASAGVAGLVIGLAAQPVLSNLIAGVQLAITQPIRIEDVVVVEGEWGQIEEITATYVVVRLWDLRRLVVPLRYFIENPFQNWTRESGALIGSVFLYLDYRAPVEAIRSKLTEIVEASPLWDRKVVSLQVTDTKGESIEVRAIASAATSSAAWNLRCDIREKLIGFLQADHPEALPRRRTEVAAPPGA
jgi:small-conductance mechanosensitive channel